MTLKRGFWWGKLSGILAGGAVGANSMALAIFVNALLNERLITEPDWIWQMILYGLLGLFAGAIVGAAVGTLLGVLITWIQLDELAPAIWSVAWAVAGLLTSLVPYELNSLLSPVVWVWVGGGIGWYCGHFFRNGVMAEPQKTAVSTQIDPA